MKFVFALVVVALCVMYMHAPGMQARPSSPDRAHKRSSGDDRQGSSSSEEEGETEEQIGEKNLGDGQNPASGRKKRAATDPAKIHLWPSTSICYRFSPKAYGDQKKGKTPLKQLMKEAADEWNFEAGLNIHEGDGDECINVKDGDGCWSWIGWQGKAADRNELVLKNPTCFTHGVILHELGHALGLIHEAKRSDRKDYIHPVMANLQAGTEGEFTIDPAAVGIQSSYLDGDVYDYCSIMHYSDMSFSKNGGKTIEMAKKDGASKDAEPCMGSQEGLSVRDGEGVAKLYGKLEDDVKKKCHHGGYLIKEDDICRCSNIFVGEKADPDCNKPTPGGCGITDTIILTTDMQTFKTPNFGGTNTYPVNSHCTWAFDVPADKQFCLLFPDGYDVEAPDTKEECSFDWFEIVLNQLLTIKTKRLCGTPQSQPTEESLLKKANGGWYLTYETNFAAVVFKSDEAYPETGFHGAVTAVNSEQECKDALEKTLPSDNAAQKPPGQKPLGQKPPGQKPPGQKPLGQKPPGQKPPGYDYDGYDYDGYDYEKPLGQKPLGQKPPGQKPPGYDYDGYDYDGYDYEKPPGQKPPAP